MFRKGISGILFLLAAILGAIELLSLYAVISRSPVGFSFKTKDAQMVYVHGVEFTPNTNIIVHFAVTSALVASVIIDWKLLRHTRSA